MADKSKKPSEPVGYYHTVRYSSMHRLNAQQKMHGVKRVITFCFLIVILPATLIILPLYLRHSVFADVVYAVAESDIIEIRDGISSIFCQQHSLRMNETFNAFQLQNRPEISTHHKHIRLKKSMTLPDDTLEYWGFYLLKGAIVELKVCSRYEGSRILVVKGERNLRTCGLLEHNKNKVGAHFAEGHEKVQVTFETVAEIVESHETSEMRMGHNRANNITLTEDELEELSNHGGEVMSDEPQPNLDQWYRSSMPDKIKPYQNKDNAISDNKTEQVLDRFLGKIHETDTDRNAINKNNSENKIGPQKIRHRRHHDRVAAARKNNQIYRQKRDHVYDRKVTHGGNALNFTENQSNSISSFENSLLTCYDGQILLAKGFSPSSYCTNVKYLESGTHMVATHEVVEDGYYYYIFYSDNDIVRNDIHAVFDIHKPTYKYANITESKFCINASNCTFPINFLSDDVVIVEVPTRDGIEHDDDDITYLISRCHPRMSVYMIFPITVLFLILSCAFL